VGFFACFLGILTVFAYFLGILGVMLGAWGKLDKTTAIALTLFSKNVHRKSFISLYITYIER
jgi:hypothetical protein